MFRSDKHHDPCIRAGFRYVIQAMTPVTFTNAICVRTQKVDASFDIKSSVAFRSGRNVDGDRAVGKRSLQLGVVGVRGFIQDYVRLKPPYKLLNSLNEAAPLLALYWAGSKTFEPLILMNETDKQDFWFGHLTFSQTKSILELSS